MAQIRGPGIPLPIDSPQNTGRPGVVTLPSGGQYLLPAGDYLIATGGQTAIQWFDDDNGIWRDYAPPGSTTSLTTDGANYRLINLSGVFVGANITNAGSGGVNGIGPTQTGSTVSFTAPAAGGVTGTATGYVVVGGSVAAPTITQAGSGFLVPPLVFCDPPPAGGVQATATATITAGGALSAITMLNVGAGYTSAPQWYIQPNNFNGFLATPDRAAGAFPPPGAIHPNNVWPGTPFQANISTSGALLTPTALTGSGTLTAIVMTYFGAGYTGAISAAASFGGTSLGAAAATAIGSFCLAVATTTTTAGAGYVVGIGMETTIGTVALTNNNNQFFPRPARGIATSTAGAFSVQDPGFGIQSNTGFTAVGGFTGITAAAYTNTNLGGVADSSVIVSSVNS